MAGSGNKYTLGALARETAKAFVAAGYGEPEDFRVRRSKDPDDLE